MRNHTRLFLLVSFLFSCTLMHAQKDFEKELLAKTKDFDSIIMLHHSPGWPGNSNEINVKGFGMKHNKCYKLYIVMAYDSMTMKMVLASIQRQAEPEGIRDSIRNIPFSAIINFKTDSLQGGCPDAAHYFFTDDGPTPHLTVIKNHKIYSASLYGAYFSEPCGSLDRIMFVGIQGKIQKLFSITKYKI